MNIDPTLTLAISSLALVAALVIVGLRLRRVEGLAEHNHEGLHMMMEVVEALVEAEIERKEDDDDR